MANEDINDMIEEIVCKLLLEDPEYQSKDASKIKRRQMHDQKKEEIIKAIRNICILVEKSLPAGISLPDDVYTKVAKKMLNEIKYSNNTIIQIANFDEKKLLKDLDISVKKENHENDVVSNEIIESSTAKILTNELLVTKESLSESVHKALMTSKVEMGDGSELTITENPENPKESFSDEQSRIEETEITVMVGNIDKWMRAVKSGDMTIEQLQTSLDSLRKSSEYHNAASAMQTYLTDYIAKDELIDNVAAFELVKKIHEERLYGQYSEDSFSLQSDLEVISILMRLESDDPKVQQMRNMYREINLDAYEIMEKNPGLYESLVAKYTKDISIEMFGDSYKHTKEEMFELINEHIKEHEEECKKVPDVIRKQEPSEEIVEPKKEYTRDEIKENCKKLYSNMYNAKGIGFVVKNSMFRMKSDVSFRDVSIEVVSEMIEANPEIIESATQEDLTLIRNAIKDCVKMQNEGKNPVVQAYTSVLTESSKQISDRLKSEKEVIEVLEVDVENDTRSNGRIIDDDDMLI